MGRIKDFHEAPALVIMTALTVMVTVILGYMLSVQCGRFLFSEKGQRASEGEVSVPDDKGTVREASEPWGKASAPTLDGSRIRIESSGDSKAFDIYDGEVRIGRIEQATPSAVKYFRRIGDDLYIGVEELEVPAGSLFGGPRELWKLSLEDDVFEQVYDAGPHVSDLSPDARRLVAFESFYVGDDIKNYITLYEFSSGRETPFEVDGKYASIGNAYFTNTGKVVYEAAEKMEDGQSVHMFILDPNSGQSMEILGGAYGQAKEWVASK